MKNFTYLIINLLIISAPLALSFDKKVSFFKNWKKLLLTIFLVDLIYVPWDIWATQVGHWGFNEDYITGLSIFGLPIEELLFFVTVPYSCLFLWEVVNYYVKDKSLFNSYGSATVLTAFFSSFVIGANDFGYTRFVSLISIVFVLCATRLIPSFFSKKKFWVWMVFCMVLFFIFNSLLTGFPVVVYGDKFILGLRIGTIPIEDFFYNFSMLGFYLLIYKLLGRAIKARRF
jgi:lycopene cyclase domain-containing protein